MEIYVYGSRSPVIILCSNDHDRNATEPLSGATVAMLSAVNPVMHAASGGRCLSGGALAAAL